MKILMVCMGNICRSPMAEGVVRHFFELNKIDAIIDSAGTIGFHTGETPDHRAQYEMRKQGIDISKFTARKFSVNDFDRFDLILTMDLENLRDVLSLARTESDKNKIQLFMNIPYPGKNIPVPDPYFGDDDGFHKVYLMLKDGAEELVRKCK
jgi:protein-tyrosine phosphatase